MKPTDELINQALKKALKRRFDSFEVQPSSRLSSEVLGAIKQSNPSNFKRFSTILVVLILGSVGTWGILQFWSESEGSNSPKIHSVLAGPGTGTFSPFLKKNKTKINYLQSSVEYGDKNPYNRRSLQTVELKAKRVQELTVQLPSGTKVILNQPRSVLSKSNADSDAYPHHIIQKATEATYRTGAQQPLITQFNDQIPSESLPKRINFDIKRLQPHQLHKKWTISTPTFIVPVKNLTSAPRIAPSQWRGVISFTPTNTYQRLTVLPQMHVQYQNFELPSLFSIQTAGYNLRVGIEKKGFQVLVNYSRFTQRIAYEIALDEYTVQAQGTTAYTIAREGKSQIEERTFQLVGLSIQKKFFIPTRALSGLYAYTGASVNHDLTTSHNLAWGTLGVGKSWPVAPAASLSLVPQLSFGLNTIKTNKDAFKNRFYQLGLAIELTLGKAEK